MKYATSTALCQLCENRSPTMFVRAFVVNILVTIPYQLNVSFLYIMLTFHLNVKYIVHWTTHRMHASLSCTLHYPSNACVPELYIALPIECMRPWVVHCTTHWMHASLRSTLYWLKGFVLTVVKEIAAMKSHPLDLFIEIELTSFLIQGLRVQIPRATYIRRSCPLTISIMPGD